MKIKVILNPKTLNRRHRDPQCLLEEQFGHYLVGIEQTTCPQHATDIARRAVKEGVDTIVAGGGDGTVNEVVNGIVGSSIAVGIIPTGTANDLASLYRIPNDLVKACKIIREGHVTEIDAINVNGWYYVTAGGMGFPCEVAGIANKVKRSGTAGKLLARLLGSKVYALAMLGALPNKNARQHSLSIDNCDTGAETVDVFALLVANQPFLGRNFIISPGAVNNDGQFDVCLIKNTRSRTNIMSIVEKTFTGKHIHAPFVKTWRGQELLISAESPLPFFGDGEVFQESVEFRIRIFPKAIKMIIPTPT